jgi:hypothetical protein
VGGDLRLLGDPQVLVHLTPKPQSDHPKPQANYPGPQANYAA